MSGAVAPPNGLFSSREDGGCYPGRSVGTRVTGPVVLPGSDPDRTWEVTGAVRS